MICDTVLLIKAIPYKRGKGRWAATDGYRALIERTDEHELTSTEDAVARLTARGDASPAQIEAARLGCLEARLRAETYVRHVRAPNQVGRMLLAMELVQQNPFEVCTFTTEEEDALKLT